MSKLCLVPTPIGNLEDISFRAIKVLSAADIILAEDTRKTNILLKHYDIKPHRIFPYHKFNEHRSVEKIVELILESNLVALVTDAGTPSISDPGFLLVRDCITNNIEVECLPGATSIIPALVNSGLPSERFCFEGFLPVKKGRQKRLTSLVNEERTMVFFESPHRVLRTINEFRKVFGEQRRISVSREISKIYEETIRGTVGEVLEYFTDNTVKGEFVLVVRGNS